MITPINTIRRCFVLGILLTIVACGQQAPTLESSWQRSDTAATATRKIDTLFYADPLVPVFLRIGGVAGLRFIGARSLNVEKFGDSLCIQPIMPDTASLLFVNRKTGDTVIRIKVMTASNPAYKAAKQYVDYGNMYYTESDSLARILYRFQLVNKSLPSLRLRSIAGDTEQFPAAFKGKPALLNRWHYACPPCLAEIPELNHLTTRFKDRFEFLALYRDSAFQQDGTAYFFDETTNSHEGKKKTERKYRTIDFRFRHFVLAGRKLPELGEEGDPLTLLVDANGIIRQYHPGGGEGIGKYLDEQLMLYEHASGFTD